MHVRRPAKPEAALDISLTQIDPAVLAELPDSVRKELLRSLAAPSAPQRPAASRPAPLPPQQHLSDYPAAAAVAGEPLQLHVADVEAAPMLQTEGGPYYRCWAAGTRRSGGRCTICSLLASWTSC